MFQARRKGPPVMPMGATFLARRRSPRLSYDVQDVIAAGEGRLGGALRGVNLDRQGGIGGAQTPGYRGERHRPLAKGQMIADVGRRRPDL